MKVRKTEENGAIAEPELFATETERQATCEPAAKSFFVEQDTEAGTIEFDFTTGQHIVLREPKAKQFLLMQSWMRTAPEEYQTEEFAMVRLAHACMKDAPPFDVFLDSLEAEDLLRLVSAIAFFRAHVEAFGRAAAAIQLPG